jgi:hypothetical protein
MGASARSASCTQRCNRLAFNPRARATAATDAPGCWQAPTASALKNMLWRRRRRRPLVMTSSVVSTCPPNPLVKRGPSFLTPTRVGKVCSLVGYRRIARMARGLIGSQNTGQVSSTP